MKTVVHRAKDRGKGEYGWLSTRYSFSFADWYDASRMGFGALRVINDDTVAPEKGFDMHQHKDMEIVTIVLGGTVTHKDSLGNTGTVTAGEVQAMSAGTGVIHAEYNDSQTEPLTLFQLWIEPETRGVTPRYAQRSIATDAAQNDLLLLVSPDGQKESLSIYQQAYIWKGSLDAAQEMAYQIRHAGNGVYLLVIDGTLDIAGQKLGRRDAMGVWDTSDVPIKAVEPTTFLLIEVPLA